MDAYEKNCKFNVAETCCASVSIDDLRQLSSEKELNPLLTSTKLTYGAIRGSDQLRDNLSSLYSAKWNSKLPIENVLIMSGAIQANFLLHYTLIGPGDHVICHYPTYQQLYSVPESLGAEVSLWKAKEEDGWKLDVKELESLVKPNTKMIILKCVLPSFRSFYPVPMRDTNFPMIVTHRIRQALLSPNRSLKKSLKLLSANQ
jgi:DNA-binding transcriptional MocR family regulator